jgi:spermidine/putrescine transport system ATP-binding protein
MPAHLRIENLTKRFGSLVAVDDVSFEVEKGEFASIVGPSGSGKTTILRTIAGFVEPTDGDVTIDNRNVINRPPFERDVNMVFQNLALFPHLTVGQNIKYGLKNGSESYTKAEIKERVEGMLEMVDLTGYGDRGIDELSGGEQQRVALARAVVKQPKVLLFDEPLASLDRKLRQDMKIELQRIQSETGITFLYVTHDQEVALSVSDQMIVLNEGEIAQKGAPEEIYDHPDSPFVADFVGDSNIVAATIDEIGAEYVIVTVGDRQATIPLNEQTSQELIGTHSVKNDVEVGFRPHHARLGTAGSTGGISLAGTVSGKTYAGDSYRYHVDLGGYTVTVSETDGTHAIGDEVNVTCPSDAVHVFGSPKRRDSVKL